MKTNIKRFSGICIFIVFAGLALHSSTAYSQVPETINYQGSLSDDGGNPINATLNILFTLYDAEVGGSVHWQEGQAVTVTDGLFSVQLGANTPITSLFAVPLFLGVQVEGDAEMTPRQALTATGYAIRAKRVESDSLSAQSCSVGQVTKWNGMGWNCATDEEGTGDITGVTAGNGLTGGGVTGDVNIAVDTSVVQNRVDGSCPAGQSIRVINANGTVTCEIDTDTTYSAGSGLALNGTTLQIPVNGINASHLANNSVGTSEVQDNSITGIDIANGTINSTDIATGAVGSNKVLNNSLTADDLAPNSVGASEIAVGAVGTSEVANNSLTGSDIALSNSLTAGHLAPNSVGASEIAANAVGLSELSTAARGVGNNARITIPAAAFQPSDDSDFYGFSLLDGALKTDSNQNICTVAPVNVPHGVTVTRFEISVRDNSPLEIGPFELKRVSFSSGSNNILAAISSNGVSPSVRVFADTTIANATINTSIYSYFIEGCFTGDPIDSFNTRLYGARIFYN